VPVFTVVVQKHVDTLLALAFLVEIIQLEQECDVCHAVQMVHQNQV